MCTRRRSSSLCDYVVDVVLATDLVLLVLEDVVDEDVCGVDTCKVCSMDIAVVALAGVLTSEVDPPNRRPELVVLVAADADGPVGVGSLEEAVGPPARHVDVDLVGARHVGGGEHVPQHLRHLRLRLVVALALDPARLVVGDGGQEHVGARVLPLERLPQRVVAAPAARVHEELLPLAHGPEPLGKLEEDLGVHPHVETVDRRDLPELAIRCVLLVVSYLLDTPEWKKIDRKVEGAEEENLGRKKLVQVFHISSPLQNRQRPFNTRPTGQPNTGP